MSDLMFSIVISLPGSEIHSASYEDLTESDLSEDLYNNIAKTLKEIAKRQYSLYLNLTVVTSLRYTKKLAHGFIDQCPIDELTDDIKGAIGRMVGKIIGVEANNEPAQ